MPLQLTAPAHGCTRPQHLITPPLRQSGTHHIRPCLHHRAALLQQIRRRVCPCGLYPDGVIKASVTDLNAHVLFGKPGTGCLAQCQRLRLRHPPEIRTPPAPVSRTLRIGDHWEQRIARRMQRLQIIHNLQHLPAQRHPEGLASLIFHDAARNAQHPLFSVHP